MQLWRFAMKISNILLFITLLVIPFLSGCEDVYTTQVRFQNNSATLTVTAVWDGTSTGSLSPGSHSEYIEVNPGTHTIQWLSASGSALTSTGWPNLVEGKSYTFPYND
jgi:hypothetical protein